MINLAQEESYKLSAKDRYDILSFAIEAADDGGFVSSFIFERAMYLYAAIILDEDRADDLREKITQNLVEAWDYAVQEKIIQEMQEKYSEDLNKLADEGWTWFEEYNNYSLSARGILSLVEQFTGNAVNSAASALQNSANQAGVTDILNIADEWGMNRTITKLEHQDRIQEKTEDESLF